MRLRGDVYRHTRLSREANGEVSLRSCTAGDHEILRQHLHIIIIIIEPLSSSVLAPKNYGELSGYSEGDGGDGVTLLIYGKIMLPL